VVPTLAKCARMGHPRSWWSQQNRRAGHPPLPVFGCLHSWQSTLMGNSHDRRIIKRLLQKYGMPPSIDSMKKNTQTLQKRSTPQPAETDRNTLLLKFRSIWGALLATMTILGAVGIVEVLPNVSVSPDRNSLSRQNPLEIPIRVANNSYLAVHAAELTCNIDELEDDHHSRVTGGQVNTATDFPIGDLGSGGSTTTFCNEVVRFRPQASYLSGHATLVLRYHYSYYPFQIEKTFHVTGLSQSDGQLLWVLSTN